MRTFAYFTSLLLLPSACQQGTELEPIDLESQVDSTEQRIIGGVEDPFDDAVVAVFVGGLCTGTLVAPRVVLTAAHCVGDAIDAGVTNTGSVRFGNGREWFDSRSVVDMAMHRFYKPPAFLQHDIALLRLSSPAPESVKPIPINTRNITDDDIGLQIRVVGFGNNDGENASGAGIKRQVTMPLKDVRPGHLGIGDTNYNTCQGDSGGPSFVSFDGVEHVVGVTSYGPSGCSGTSYVTRTDVMWDEFLTEVLNAWSGPCQNDGVCTTDGCTYTDPDCDVCGMDGVCGQDCERVDFDCPLGSLTGESCGSATDCESRVCLTAPEDSRVQYCSHTCDPNAPIDDNGCRAPVTICEDQGDGTGICRYPGTTPGVQGSTCEDGSDCRSGMCDSRDEVCVEPCGDGLDECTDGYECQKVSGLQVCALPEEGNCSVSSARGGLSSGLLLLLGMMVGLRRRRRD